MSARNYEREAAVVAILTRRRCGTHIEYIQEQLGCTRDVLRKALDNMRMRGLVACARSGRKALWALPRDAQILQAHMDANSRTAGLPADDPVLKPKHERRPAATAPRIETRAVASVFDLAHAA